MFNEYLEKFGEIGYIEKVVPPIAYIRGLPSVTSKEVLYLESGELARVESLSEDFVEAIVFSDKAIPIGARGARSGSLLTVPVGEELLGFTINALGHSIYPDKPVPSHLERREINKEAPGIAARKKIKEPLETGVSVVDMLVPLGKGQRELVLGDRKTGKSNFLLQTMLSQAKKGSICIYAGIGKKKIDIKKVEEFLLKHDIAKTSIIVASSSSDPIGEIYITPYSAMAIAEYYKDMGKDVLLILDDLSTHAKFYREISLLGNKFPGRSSYPGDIFYTHAKLLERGGNFLVNGKEVSITCLPVAETVEGDISGYIQTNLMSITDGHIFFDKELFSQGRRPAVNYFLSVTRVGRQTQDGVRWGVSRELNSFLTLLEKTQGFVHFGAELNEGIAATIKTGEKIIAFFNQNMDRILDIQLQVFMYCLIWVGTWSGKDNTAMHTDLEKVYRAYTGEKSYADKVRDLVMTSADFNVLLGKISSLAQSLLDEAANISKGGKA